MSHPRPRELSGEAAAFARRAVDGERRAVARERVFDDGEAEARAAGLARAAAIDAIEALGQARDVLRRDADARVLDLEGRALVALAPAKAHDAPFRRIADGVA